MDAGSEKQSRVPHSASGAGFVLGEHGVVRSTLRCLHGYFHPESLFIVI